MNECAERTGSLGSPLILRLRHVYGGRAGCLDDLAAYPKGGSAGASPSSSAFWERTSSGGRRFAEPPNAGAHPPRPVGVPAESSVGPSLAKAASRILVIGWGNELRRDDGAGRCVAREVAAREWPDVEVLDVHQLTPELALSICASRSVIFVDACPVTECAGLSVQPVDPVGEEAPFGVSSIGHTGSPGALLRLTKALYGVAPPAWLVAIPAESFDAGDHFSSTTAAAVPEAVREVEHLVRTMEERFDEDSRCKAVE